MNTLYLIDLENVQSAGLEGVELLTEDDYVLVFYSNKADNLKIDLVKKIKDSPAEVDYIKADNGTPNALDFQLITYLFCHLQAADQFWIVSKDTGYDASIKMCRRLDVKNVRRAPAIKNALHFGIRAERSAALKAAKAESEAVPGEEENEDSASAGAAPKNVREEETALSFEKAQETDHEDQASGFAENKESAAAEENTEFQEMPAPATSPEAPAAETAGADLTEEAPAAGTAYADVTEEAPAAGTAYADGTEDAPAVESAASGVTEETARGDEAEETPAAGTAYADGTEDAPAVESAASGVTEETARGDEAEETPAAETAYADGTEDAPAVESAASGVTTETARGDVAEEANAVETDGAPGASEEPDGAKKSVDKPGLSATAGENTSRGKSAGKAALKEPDPERLKKLRTFLKDECELDADAHELALLSEGLDRCENKNQFYHFFRRRMGAAHGSAFYKSIRSQLASLQKLAEEQ